MKYLKFRVSVLAQPIFKDQQNLYLYNNDVHIPLTEYDFTTDKLYQILEFGYTPQNGIVYGVLSNDGTFHRIPSKDLEDDLYVVVNL